MPSGLGEHALRGVHQNNRHIGGGGTSDHVPCVLLVAGGVGDNELAMIGAKEAVGHINGDALLALGGQTVYQQRKVNITALGTLFF